MTFSVLLKNILYLIIMFLSIIFGLLNLYLSFDNDLIGVIARTSISFLIAVFAYSRYMRLKRLNKSS